MGLGVFGILLCGKVAMISLWFCGCRLGFDGLGGVWWISGFLRFGGFGLSGFWWFCALDVAVVSCLRSGC